LQASSGSAKRETMPTTAALVKNSNTPSLQRAVKRAVRESASGEELEHAVAGRAH
jgi:hypothetical protein